MPEATPRKKRVSHHSFSNSPMRHAVFIIFFPFKFKKKTPSEWVICTRIKSLGLFLTLFIEKLIAVVVENWSGGSPPSPFKSLKIMKENSAD